MLMLSLCSGMMKAESSLSMALTWWGGGQKNREQGGRVKGDVAGGSRAGRAQEETAIRDKGHNDGQYSNRGPCRKQHHEGQ